MLADGHAVVGGWAGSYLSLAKLVKNNNIMVHLRTHSSAGNQIGT